jgi:hypothetical protein
LRTTTSFIFSAFANVFFGAPFGFGFGAHLCLDFGTELRLLFSTLQSFRFSDASCFFFDSSPLSFFRQHPSFFGGLYARVLAQAQTEDFLFNRGDPHVRAPPNFVFLRALPGFGIKKLALLVNANTSLFCFKLSHLLQFSLMRDCGGLKLRFNFGTPRVFHCAHAVELFLNALQFFFGNAAARFFSSAFTRFRFDAQLLLLGAA